jgi:hypothetical protein
MLCTQQYDYLRSFLPVARTRLLIGADNVDRWREQRIWEAMLEEIQIDVSTHAVLADALSHSFAKMSRLALIVFIEGTYVKPFQHSSADDS